MRTIAIVLGDNDFGRTFVNLLETLKRSMEWRVGLYPQREHLTEEEIRAIIQNLILGHYVAFQYRFNLNRTHPFLLSEDIMNTVYYLQKNARVLFDEAAEADILTGDHDGGAWYLEIQSGIVTSY